MASTTTKKTTAARRTTPAKTTVPDGVKRPTDRQDKAAKAEATDQQLQFEHAGRTYTIDPAVGRDVELMEAIGDMQDGAAYLLPRVCKAMLGAEQYDEWKESVRDPHTGRVDAEHLGELFSSMDELLGNSAASSGS